MKTRTLYRKTIAYVWLKLLLSVVSALAAIVLFLLLVTALTAIGEGPGTAGFIVWVIVLPLIYPFVKYFFGHRIIAGHLNAINDGLTTERLPLDLLKTVDKETVEKFPTFSAYKEKELDVTNSVKQLYQRISDSVNLFDGITTNEWFRKIVIKSSTDYLSYISSACIAQIFAKPSQMQEKTLVHSIGVFFRNWQKFLIDTYRITSRNIIMFAVILVLSVAFCIAMTILIAGAGFMTVVLGIGLGVILSQGIKNAFIDPFYIITVMKTFAIVEAEDIEDTDSYKKMAVLSPAFTQLYKKAGGGVEYTVASTEETAIIKTDEQQ